MYKDPHSDFLGADASVFVALKSLKKLLVLGLLFLSQLSYSQKLQEYKSTDLFFSSEVKLQGKETVVEVFYSKSGKEQLVMIPFREVTDSIPDANGFIYTDYPTGLKTIRVKKHYKQPNIVLEVKEI